MCIPQGDAGAGGGALAAGLADLRKTRDDVLAEVTDAARRGAALPRALLAAALAARGAAAAASRSPRRARPGPPLAAGCVGAAATAGLHYVNGNEAARRLAGSAGPPASTLYRKAYGAELVRGDEEANALWARVRDHLLRKLDAVAARAACQRRSGAGLAASSTTACPRSAARPRRRPTAASRDARARWRPRRDELGPRELQQGFTLTS
ncbi:hypothetical protein JL720_12089 [Aureococcus anophagefferens]|nr:hypothetical protein JL720_12089 [Aureococcus anophagefferens]